MREGPVCARAAIGPPIPRDRARFEASAHGAGAGTGLAMTGPMSTPPPTTTTREVRDASVKDLVSGIMSDTGDLLGAHVDSVRNELTESIHDLRDRTRAAIVAAAVGLAATFAVILALGATLIALGLPAWAAYWIVAAPAIVAVIVLVRRAAQARRGRASGDPLGAVKRARNDATWLADRAGDAVT